LKALNKKIATLSVIGALAIGGMTACSGQPTQLQQRQEAQKSSQITNSLEKQNAQMKRDKEEDPNAIRYVYLLNYGINTGYYVAKGKISSSSSQVGPESEVVWHNGSAFTLDSAKDDGTYGPGDPGIYFFTTDGMMVETSLDYIVTDRPIALQGVPLLGGTMTPAAKK
jgi:hypothetical protein